MTQNLNTDEDDESNGLSVLFLTWLMRSYTLAQITQVGGVSLAATYKALTGKATAFADFSAAVNVNWPQGVPSGVVSDNPW